MRIVEVDGDRTTTQEGFVDEARKVSTVTIASSDARAPHTANEEGGGRIGETAFQCDDGECRFTAGGASDDMTLQTLLLNNEPSFFMIKTGIPLAFLGGGGLPASDRLDGVDAWKSTSGQSKLWIQKDPTRFLRAEIVQDQGSSYPLRFVNTTFGYGAALPAALARAETLTMTDQDAAREYRSLQSGYDDGRSHLNFTFPRVTSPASVPLADVTLRVLDRYDDGIVMSLENKTAKDARIEVAFEDTDANGLVSAGDVLRLHVLGPGTNAYNPLGVEDFTVALVDEKGWTVVPGLGL